VREREREINPLTLYNNLRSNLEFEEHTELCTGGKKKKNDMMESREISEEESYGGKYGD
jgi:hypothetical protein